LLVYWQRRCVLRQRLVDAPAPGKGVVVTRLLQMEAEVLLLSVRQGTRCRLTRMSREMTMVIRSLRICSGGCVRWIPVNKILCRKRRSPGSIMRMRQN